MRTTPSDLYDEAKAQGEAKEIVDALDRGEAGSKGYGYIRSRANYVAAENLIEGRTPEEKAEIIRSEQRLCRFVEVLEHEFRDAPWDLVEAAIRSSFYSHGGEVTLKWSGSLGDGEKEALEISATTYGRGPKNKNPGGNAVVKWHTKAGYYAELYFEPQDWDTWRTEHPEDLSEKALPKGSKGFDEWVTTAVKIDEKPESYHDPFYGNTAAILKRVAEVREIPVTIISEKAEN